VYSHPDKNKSENAHEMFQKVSEAYKRITDPDSFKEDDVEMDETDLYEMFQEVFSDMFSPNMGNSGFGSPLDFMEMMMAQEMGMFFDDDDYDDDDEDEDGEEYDENIRHSSHAQMMHNIASMMSAGMSSHSIDSDDEDYYDDDMPGMSQEQFQQMLMNEMLGANRNSSGLDIEEHMFLDAMRGMGIRIDDNRGKGRGKSNKNNCSKTSGLSNKNVGKEVVIEDWHTDSSDEEKEGKAHKQKKAGVNAKKNKRKGICFYKSF
jgi:DnaJ-class molecular chaperone